MGDDTVGAQQTTDFVVTIENKSSSSLANFRVFVTDFTGVAGVSVFPGHVHIPELAENDTETCHFLVANHTGDTQETFEFQVQTDYGLGIKNYNNFVIP